MNNFHSQRGQVLLIVVLVMTIALTIGLSIATRTITNIKTSTQEETSQRAFSAAEAGIEKSLQESTNATGSFTNNTSFQTSVVQLAGKEFFLNNGSVVLKDDATDLWLSTYPGYTSPWTGNVTVYWGSSSDVCDPNENVNTMAALEVLIISGSKAAPVVDHYPVDPCAARAGINNFEQITAGGGNVNGKAFAFKRSFVISSGLLMRIIPLYSGTTIGVKGCDGSNNGCSSLPTQGTLVTSVGTAGDTQRKIIGLKENPKLPLQIFPYAIFSPK